VDKYGQTIDFLLTEHRDTEAALRFLKKAIRRNGLPEMSTIDGSEANAAAIKSYNEEHGMTILIRQVKYLNNIVEQDHRAVKRVTRAMLGFKSFEAAQDTLAGIELMHMIKKRQRVMETGEEHLTAALGVVRGGRGSRCSPHRLWAAALRVSFRSARVLLWWRSTRASGPEVAVAGKRPLSLGVAGYRKAEYRSPYYAKKSRLAVFIADSVSL
jgi:hypothetical protein